MENSSFNTDILVVGAGVSGISRQPASQRQDRYQQGITGEETAIRQDSGSRGRASRG